MLNNPRTPYMLTERHFMMTLAVALALHMSGFVVWSISPKQKVQDITIRSMNIRLGEADDELENPEAAMNSSQVEAAIDQATQNSSPSPEVDSGSVRQYVREINTPRSKKTKGSRNGARDAEIMSRYTQMISVWIQKFIVYPDEARKQGLKGATVVRIRIDRRGNIRYHALERTTGSELLDRAAIDMIRRANPVPAVPDDYPPGELFEFLVPVNFSLL